MWRSLAMLVVCAGCGRINFADRKSMDGSLTGDALDGDAGPPRFSALTAYGDQTCALYAGNAYCWGNNASGQIGDATTSDAAVPTRVRLPAGTVEAIAQGDSHGCAIVGGQVYCWGTLGGPMPTLYALPLPAIAVAAGNGFACAIADTVRCWGANTVGQCGTGTQSPAPTPTPVAFTGTFPATAIEAGDDHACASAPGLAPQCWGHNDNGTLGIGSTTPSQSLFPVSVIGGVMSLPHIAGWHACALSGTGAACWGEGTLGELGNGMTADASTAMPVSTLASVTAIETGGGPVDHDASCAIDRGNVYCWGRGNDGRLGNAMTTAESMPVAVIGLPDAATSVALGYGHTCALLTTGDVYCWGRGAQGQLGDGNQTASLAPVRVLPP